jgi:hypothetical protein
MEKLLRQLPDTLDLIGTQSRSFFHNWNETRSR